jgi:hypothetical protein
MKLKDDHDAVKSQFKQFEKTGDRAVKTKRQLVSSGEIQEPNQEPMTADSGPRQATAGRHRRS